MSSLTTKTYRTFSSEETKRLGFDTARALRRGPAAFALRGDLGAGKTTFVQGFLRGLGSRARVTSPTFVLMHRHKLARKPFLNVFHIDAYRLKSPEQFSALEIGDVLEDPRNIVLVEWPEQAKALLPRHTVRIAFSHGRKENERIITVTMPPPGAQKRSS